MQKRHERLHSFAPKRLQSGPIFEAMGKRRMLWTPKSILAKTGWIPSRRTIGGLLPAGQTHRVDGKCCQSDRTRTCERDGVRSYSWQSERLLARRKPYLTNTVLPQALIKSACTALWQSRDSLKNVTWTKSRFHYAPHCACFESVELLPHRVQSRMTTSSCRSFRLQNRVCTLLLTKGAVQDLASFLCDVLSGLLGWLGSTRLQKDVLLSVKC